MRILLISNAFLPEMTGIGPYSGALAAYLVTQGHQVDVVCANPSFPAWRLYPGYSAMRWKVADEHGSSVHRCPIYIPKRVTALRRLLHYVSFAISAFWPIFRICLHKKPDVIICVAPTLFAAPLALIGARVACAKTWLHVQDFEVDAAFGTGQIRSTSLSGRLARGYERWCIRRFDRASSISPEMCRGLVSKGMASTAVVEFRNWADLDPHTPLATSVYRSEWNVTEPHVALYSGSIGKKQGIELIATAARHLSHRDDIRFIICGNGPDRLTLEAAIADLKNVTIHDLQPRTRLNELLSLATIHLLPQLAGAADAVLPSKLTNMLASGRPSVIAASPDTGLAREAQGCALIVPPENPEAFAAAIEALTYDSELSARLGNASRVRASTVWDKAVILRAMEHELLSLVNSPKSAAR